MKILCTTSSFNKNLIPENFEVTYNPYQRKLSEQELIELILKTNPSGLIAGVEPLTRNVLENASDLKVISRCGAGVDTVDLDAATELGIVVTNTPDSPTVAVAELTVGLVLSMLRQIHLSDTGIRNGEWIKPMGYLLKNKTIGIIGCGRIGSYVGSLLKSFGCIVLGYDSLLNDHKICKLTTLEDLLAQSDIVLLHLPYSNETHHFIGDSELKKMKKNSFLVNTSRGGLVDEHALFLSLTEGRLKGAAIDCFGSEPYLGELASVKNVVMSAHIGSYAMESRELQERQSIDNLINELRKLNLI